MWNFRRFGNLAPRARFGGRDALPRPTGKGCVYGPAGRVPTEDESLPKMATVIFPRQSRVRSLHSVHSEVESRLSTDYVDVPTDV
jgi:hypothetical protein